MRVLPAQDGGEEVGAVEGNRIRQVVHQGDALGLNVAVHEEVGVAVCEILGSVEHEVDDARRGARRHPHVLIEHKDERGRIRFLLTCSTEFQSSRSLELFVTFPCCLWRFFSTAFSPQGGLFFLNGLCDL